MPIHSLQGSFSGRLLTDPADMAPFLIDWRKRWTGKAIAVALPDTTEDVASVVRWCAANQVPIVPQGGNTGLVLGATPDRPQSQVVLSLERMTAIRRIDVDDFSAVVEAGCILSEFKDAVSREGMFFPLAYFALLSFRSDWWLSDWYLYPIRVAVACALAHWLSLPTCRAWLAAPWRLALGGAVAAIALLTTSWSVNPGQLAVYQAAAALAEFEKTHPGTYAMGDRAGKVGYLMRHPVVQLEGLVMDKPFLAFMKRSAPLAEVLAHYDADYYVGSSHEPFDRCFTAVEPFQAGPRSPRIVGEFCDEPVARFRFGGVETLVYRVKKG